MPVCVDVRPTAVAIYIRWSTEEQTEGTTLETQRERCSLYVRSQGWQLNRELIFIDDGYSGANLERPALTALRERVKAGTVDCVVSYSLDRLSRSVADTVQLVQTEWLGKCAYRSASQPISTDEGNPTGQLIFNILASFAEFERALIRDRTHSGHVRRAKEGKYPGSKKPPYGYKRSGKGQLVLDSLGPDGELDGPAAVVRRMFALATAGPIGRGPAMIVRALAEEGIPSPTGGPWWVHVVRTMLRNPVYCGDLVYGRLPVNPAHKRDRSAPQRIKGQKPLVSVEGAVVPIVSKAIWLQAQRLGEDRAETWMRRNLYAKNRSLLGSLARCKCGGPLSVFYDGKKQRYYRCSRNCLSAGGCLESPGVLHAEVMERVVIQAVKHRYGTPELRHSAIEIARTALVGPQRSKQYGNQITAIDKRLEQIEADLLRVRRVARRGDIQLGTYEDLRADAEAERVELQSTRTSLQRALDNTEQNQAALADWQKLVDQVDLWDELDVSSQREILFGLLRGIVLYRRKGSQDPAEIDLTWEEPME